MSGEFKKRLDQLLTSSPKEYEFKRIYNWVQEAKKEFPSYEPVRNLKDNAKWANSALLWFNKWFGKHNGEAP